MTTNAHILAIGAALILAPLPAQGTPHPDPDRAHHVLRRITFGPTRPLVAQLRTGTPAVQTYINAQLNPPATSAPNYHGSPALVELLTGSIVPGTRGTLLLPTTMGGVLTQLQTSAAQVAYALESEWQLRELMTQFWERHFNTNTVPASGYFTPWVPPGADVNNWGWWFEWEANERYRADCLTTFHDLLRFTSRHASMMIYLHMPQNNGSQPNEDYARELVELYTMSPEHITATGTLNNYTQSDVEQIARILTGWDLDEVNGFVFQYDDIDHAYPTSAPTLFATSAQTVSLQQRFPPNTGQQEGDDLLLELARHPATASFVCRKLIAYFLDEPLAAQLTSPVLTAMLAAWGQQGAIRPVLAALFGSSEFLGSTYHRTRVRIPLESVVGTARAIEAKVKRTLPPGLADPTSMFGMAVTTALLGQQLLMYPAPNGFPTSNKKQFSPSASLVRAYWGWNIFLKPETWELPATDVVGFVQPVVPPLPTNPTRVTSVPHLLAVVDYFLESFYGSNYTYNDEVRVVDALVGAIAWVDSQTMGPVIGPWDPAVPLHYWIALVATSSAALGFVQSGQR